MRVSLRVRVLVLVFGINILLFGAGGWYLASVQRSEAERTEREHLNELLFALSHSIRPEVGVQAAALLTWPGWERVEDAVVVQAVRTEPVGPPGSEGDGEVQAELKGLRINPLGFVGRVGFDAGVVDEALLQAVRDLGEVEGVGGGRAFAIRPPSGGVWGACWYRSIPVDQTGLALTLIKWFLGTTLLLTAGTFFSLNRLVLQPVASLAQAASDVRRGAFHVRASAPPRHDEVADLVRDFNAMTAEVEGFNARLEQEVQRARTQEGKAVEAAMIQRRLAAMGELAAGIAHEINNPLGGLQNALERLRSGELTAERREEYFGLLERGLERIGRTVSQLLRFTPRKLEHAPVDLADVARDAADLVRHRAERQAVEVVIDEESPGASICLGARNELGQAVLNLLVNALDALEEFGASDGRGPRIELAISGSKDEVRLVVSDNGPGVAAAEVEKLLDLFYSTKEVGRGSGLGLALVHNAVLSHGGTFELKSDAGAGFTATMALPAVGRDGGHGPERSGEGPPA